MTEIGEKDFKLKPVSDNCFLFDLELLYTIKPRNGEPREEFKNVAYGCTLQHAIEKIIQYRISKKYDTLDLKTYLNEFKKQIINLKTLLNEYTNP